MVEIRTKPHRFKAEKTPWETRPDAAETLEGIDVEVVALSTIPDGVVPLTKDAPQCDWRGATASAATELGSALLIVL